MTADKLEKKQEQVVKATELTQELQGTFEQRMTEEKTILVKLIPGKRPEVMFTGFWTGKFIRSAQNAIAKNYRVRRHSASRPLVVQEEPKGIQVTSSLEDKKGSEK